MGKYADRWRQNWGSFWSEYGSHYKAAAECKDLPNKMDRIDCAVEKMKEVKRARQGRFSK